MKNLLLMLFLLLLPLTFKAQISLENDYPASATLTEFDGSVYKFYVMDVANNACNIYNTDHSLWKTVSLSVPQGMYLYDIRYVSDKLFDTDNSVELAYIYYYYDTTLYYYTYYARVIDETGLELLSIPGCAYVDVRSAGADGYKLLAYVYNYSIVNWTVNTRVYSLPGTLPVSAIDPEGETAIRLPYPNPAGETVTIPYDLPGGINSAEINLLNSNGQAVRTYRVDRNFHDLHVNTGELPPGVYIYQVTSGSGILNSGKIVVR